MISCNFEGEEKMHNQYSSFEEILDTFKTHYFKVIGRNNKQGVVTQDDEIIIPCQYDMIQYMGRNSSSYYIEKNKELNNHAYLFEAIICSSNQLHIYNSEGKLVLNQPYVEFERLDEGYCGDGPSQLKKDIEKNSLF